MSFWKIEAGLTDESEPGPIMKAMSFAETDPFAPPRDVTSDFHKAHSREACEQQFQRLCNPWAVKTQDRRLEKFHGHTHTELRKFSLRDYLQRMKAKGERLQELIPACDASIREELWRIAKEEDLL